MNVRLLERIAHHARTRPDAIAVREAGDLPRRSLSWRALHDAAARLAQQLRDENPHPVIVVSAANRLEVLVALVAGLASDGAVLPVSPEVPAAQLRDVAARAGASVAIGGPDALETLGDRVARRIAIASIDLRPADPRADLASTGHHGALLLLSSGTTDVPKLVRRDAAALDTMGRDCQSGIGVRPDDGMLLAIPLHHSYGIDQGLLTALFAGCRVELHDGFDLARVRTSLRDDAVTLLPAVPFLFDVLARGGLEAPALRKAISAGGPLPIGVFEAFRNSTGVAIGQIYGATEFGSVTYGDPDAPGFAPESVGRPLPGVVIRVLDPADPRPDQPLAVGEEGQLAVAAPSALSAYVGDTTTPLHDGFFLTGDLGRFDAAGRLTLTGRTSLLIDVAGRKVNPLEVEAALARHPRVAEVVVVPIAYSRTVGRMKAIVVPAGAGDLHADELRAFLRERLDGYKIPRRFEFLATLPRSAAGKVLRRELEGAGSPS